MDVNAIFSFFQNCHPFSLLDTATLEQLAAGVETVTYPAKKEVYKQHATEVNGVDVVAEGKYETFFVNSDGQKIFHDEVNPGQSYGAFSILLNSGKSIKHVVAFKGTTVYRISEPMFRNLCEAHPGFYDDFLHDFGKEILNQGFSHFLINRGIDLEMITFDRYFNRRLDTVNLRPIVSCGPHTPSHDAARQMETEKISCLFVEENGRYIGYVTDIVLRNKIVGEQRHSATPVHEIMSTDIATIHRDVYAYEAILQMFHQKIRYMIVLDGEEPIGVISRSRLLSDQAQSPFVFIQSVRSSLSIDELRTRWNQVPEVVYHLLTRGVKSELVNQVITTISDTISQKVIETVIGEIGPPPARFVFMSLGSEGRMEQTLKTDQDNAIIYEDKANEFREKTRTYFLDFAERVSSYLNHIGFSYCTGGLMAKNPKWTHSLSHWKRNYDSWIESPNPQAVMNYSTFFDCRAIYGEASLIQELQEHILQQVGRATEYFFSQLANNALQYEPPLTFFKSIRTFSRGDLKVFNIKHAMTPIVDLVRVYALKNRIIKTNTGERLQALRELGIFSEEDFHELMQSYYYLMGMRLKHQAHQISYDKQAPDNYVNIATLTKIEVVTLKEIFKVIEDFQQRIRMIFTRNLFG